MAAGRKYTQRHFRDIAGLLAAEREANGASPALNRITDAFITLFAEDSKASAASGDPRFFRPELFRGVALGEKPVNTPAPRRGRKTPARQGGPGGGPVTESQPISRCAQCQELTDAEGRHLSNGLAACEPSPWAKSAQPPGSPRDYA